MSKFYMVVAALTLIASMAQARVPSQRKSDFISFPKISKSSIMSASQCAKAVSGGFKLQTATASEAAVDVKRSVKAGSEANTCTVYNEIPSDPGYHILGLGFASQDASYWDLAENPYQFDVAPGIYTFVLILEGDDEGVPVKIFVKEGVEVSDALELTMNPAECTELVKFEPVLPDGSVIEGETANTDFEIIKEGNVTQNSYIYYAFGSKKLGTLVNGETGFGTLQNGDETVEWARKGDFLINPGVSSDFQCAQVQIVITNDEKKTPLIICAATESPVAQTVTNTADFGYTSYDKQFTTEYYGLETTFVNAVTFFSVNIFDLGNFIFKITGKGKEIALASEIGMNTASLPKDCFMYANLRLNRELHGEEFPVPDQPLLSYHNSYCINPAVSNSVDGRFMNYVLPDTIDYFDFLNLINSEGKLDSQLLLYGNPSYSFHDDETRQRAGDNVPILVFKDLTIGMSLSFPGFWYNFYEPMGRVGETPQVCSPEKFRLEFKDKNFDIYSDWPTIEYGRELKEAINYVNDNLANYRDKINLEIENTGLITVDGIAGKSKINAEWNWGRSLFDANVPTLTMLQFRNTDNVVTDHFENSSEGVIMLSAADFKPVYEIIPDEEGNRIIYYSNLDYNGCPEVTVEYAPFGSEDWTEIEVEEDPEKFYMPGYGAYFSGSLAAVDKKSPNGWMKLRISLADSSKNKLVTEISPAFHVSSLSGIDEINPESTELIYKIEGRSIIVPRGTDVYNTDGVKVNPENLTPGVYILRNNALSTKCLLN